jgi:hypothetical protein
VKRPDGAAPPSTMLASDGSVVDIQVLAREICSRFYVRFPEELERSGEVGLEWCRHDNGYLVAWAIQEARDGTISLVDQALWLAGVLDARNFPLERLAGNLELAADVLRERIELGALAGRAADALGAGAAAVTALAATSEQTPAG